MNQQPGNEEIDYLVLGHVTQDVTPQGYRLGGTAAYASLLAHRLGLQVGLVTALSEDLSLSLLDDIRIQTVTGKHTTTFENQYPSSGRIQFLHHLAPPLTYQHIPSTWRAASIVHLAPVAGEIESKLMVKFPRSFTGISLQGWLREWDEKGRVRPSLTDISLSVCHRSAIPIFSYEDVANDRGLVTGFARQCPILIVTNGVHGADIYDHGEKIHIPTLPREERDPTGAGDIFASAFFIHYVQHGVLVDAAHFATSLAALSVTRRGLNGVPTKVEIRTLEGVS